MVIQQSMKKIATYIMSFLKRPLIIIYFFFACSFSLYAISDLLTSAQTYHRNADRTWSYVFLGFLLLSIVIGIVYLSIKSVREKTIKQLLSSVNFVLVGAIFSLIIIEAISSLINNISISEVFSVLVYPVIFLLIYIFFVLMKHFKLEKQYINNSFLFFFILYALFFIFYFFYIQGKPLGGTLRMPTLAHVFFSLSIFCYLRRVINEKSKIALYFIFLPIVVLSGKMSVTVILFVFLLSDLITSSFFKKNKTIMRVILIFIFVVSIGIIIISNTTQGNFLANNFSFKALIYSGRLENWSNILPHVKEFTFAEWLFGKGPGATMQYNNGTAAHNDFIEYLFDFGVIGLLALLGFVASLFYQYFSNKNIDKREMKLMIFYLLTLNLISAFFINMNMLFMILPVYDIEKGTQTEKQIKEKYYEVTI